MNGPARTALGAAALALSVIAVPAAALDVQVNGVGLMIGLVGDAGSITISGPDGYRYESAGPNPASLFAAPSDIGIRADGHYVYEVREVVYRGTEIVDDPVNGREGVVRNIVLSSEVVSGSFLVQDGIIVTDDGVEESR